jgi:hypothetical protein
LPVIEIGLDLEFLGGSSRRNIGYHRDLFGGAADFERDIDLRAIVHAQLDRSTVVSLESGVRDFERVL